MSVTFIPNDYYIKRVRTTNGTILTYMHINRDCWYIYKLSRGWYYRQSFATSIKKHRHYDVNRPRSIQDPT